MFRNRDISPNTSMLDAMKKMDELDCKLLIVIENSKFIGLISIGDVQRAILAGRSLDTPVVQIIRTTNITGSPKDTIDTIRDLMAKYRMEFYPIVRDDNTIEQIYYWADLFEGQKRTVEKFSAPVVIMAGGYGTRLKPLTNVIPKPLIPIGERTMLEEIFLRFYHHGCSSFYLSVNYKADLIEYYLNEQNLPYTIEYFKENEPLGTAGSLILLKDKIDQTFFVNNCDIIIEDDYAQFLQYHKEQSNDITLIAAVKSYHIPYGTVETGENGILKNLKEKPEASFLINSGMYILEPKLLDMIPAGRLYHITDLIKDVQAKGGKAGVFPVSEKAWIDMGDWDEYLRLIRH